MTIIEIPHPHFLTLGSMAGTPANSTTYQSKAGMGWVNVRRDPDGQYVATAAMYDGSPLPVHAEPLAWADDIWDVLDAVHAQR
jgi:hypothetical protein